MFLTCSSHTAVVVGVFTCWFISLREATTGEEVLGMRTVKSCVERCYIQEPCAGRKVTGLFRDRALWGRQAWGSGDLPKVEQLFPAFRKIGTLKAASQHR